MLASEQLSQELADAREQAQVLANTGNRGQAEYIDQLVDRFRAAAEDFITWLSESESMIKSGLSERTLRRRFREMVDCGTARYGANGQREYLACCIPRRPDLAAARARGRGGKAA